MQIVSTALFALDTNLHTSGIHFRFINYFSSRQMGILHMCFSNPNLPVLKIMTPLVMYWGFCFAPVRRKEITSCKIPCRAFAYLHILGHKSYRQACWNFVLVVWGSAACAVSDSLWCTTWRSLARSRRAASLWSVESCSIGWGAVDARGVSALLEESLFLDVTTQPSLALLLSNMSLLFRAFHRRIAKYGMSCSMYSREVRGLTHGRTFVCVWGRDFFENNFCFHVWN